MRAETIIQPSFLVVVHDVAPPFMSALCHIEQQLRPLVGDTLAGAVVPCWHGEALQPGDPIVAHARTAYAEILLHGCTHRSHARGPIALLTDGADEFSALPADETARRLDDGQALLGRCFGAAARGFVAPAWQIGRLSGPLLRAAGITYRLGLRALRPTDDGAPHPMAVWSWDCGRLAALGLAGDLLGAARRAAIARATPCIVLHPADVARGYLGRARALIAALLAEGLRPTTPGDLARAIAARGRL